MKYETRLKIMSTTRAMNKFVGYGYLLKSITLPPSQRNYAMTAEYMDKGGFELNQPAEPIAKTNQIDPKVPEEVSKEKSKQ